MACLDHNNFVICHQRPKTSWKALGLTVLIKSREAPELTVIKATQELYRKFLEKWQAMHNQPNP